jgi:sulfur carrier protein
MKIYVNGEPETIEDVSTLEEFLGSKRISKGDRGIAVAVNDDVVPKSDWASRKLEEGARIEIVRAVQGGGRNDPAPVISL